MNIYSREPGYTLHMNPKHWWRMIILKSLEAINKTIFPIDFCRQRYFISTNVRNRMEKPNSEKCEEVDILKVISQIMSNGY